MCPGPHPTSYVKKVVFLQELWRLAYHLTEWNWGQAPACGLLGGHCDIAGRRVPSDSRWLKELSFGYSPAIICEEGKQIPHPPKKFFPWVNGCTGKLEEP